MCIPKSKKLLTLSAGMWCFLQFPVVHSHLFGLVDVEVGGVLSLHPLTGSGTTVSDYITHHH